ncbi:hypothetical protein GCM10011512_00970 [Tersicoccus solisilvae]|uniref:Aminoglycoside phosphotransferase domain-containing protein n=1 Tax=Tersicoccus solisilvae TaxID=1882339 RepID=A0ABQ1NIU1_9MICC|nr:aminoglycoside phosphotransferase family protein [Tersicoccus solisilvae]GGC78233.1 hypothetical protein GCM10011512_00970 [Tersicoccus solisilvae]
MSDALTAEQRRLLSSWLGDWEQVADLSWPLQDITVLHGCTATDDVVIKASPTTHHIAREIRAHRRMVGSLAGRTPRLLHADREHRILVTRYLPGELVQGTDAERDPETYRQAGQLLARLHGAGSDHVNAGYDGAALDKIGDLIRRAEGLVDADQLAAIRSRAARHRLEPRPVTATHGDYQPRNWLIHDGVVSVIDWGRAGYRPWVSDLIRLAHQLTGSTVLWEALLAGYGRDPADEPGAWLLDNLLQSVGTVVWAHDVGDPVFEAEGRAMVARVLDRWGS